MLFCSYMSFLFEYSFFSLYSGSLALQSAPLSPNLSPSFPTTHTEGPGIEEKGSNPMGTSMY